MQISSVPAKLTEPFATSGSKNTIPVPSQIGITAGAASYTDGFPPLTMTPVASGGVPPSGLDMNGILFAATDPLVWYSAGGGFPYDAAFSASVGGYPQGARVMRSDGTGYWLNTVDNNVTAPEGSTPTGWVPDFTNGLATIAMTSANVTLTPAQYGKPIIVLTGVLTANLNLILPNITSEWIVVNNCTGAYTMTCKTAAGIGPTIPASAVSIVYGDGTNIYIITNSSAGGTAITGLTGDVAATGPGNATATLASSGVTAGSYTKANISVDAKGRVTAASNGVASGTQSVVTGSRAYGGVYQNTSGKTMIVTVGAWTNDGAAQSAYTVKTDSSSTPTTTVLYIQDGNDSSITLGKSFTFCVLAGNYYSVTTDSGTTTINSWTEWTIG